MSYKMVIGLEVHVELKTASKIFCGCSTHFGAEPNSNVCPVCLGLPGVLPVLNKQVVDFAIRAGLALNCKIAKFSKFDRKNYYYPDLPKNFQTSQLDFPIAEHGYLDIEVDGYQKRIGITRIHMEEDAGKLSHAGSITKSDYSLVNYNRTGVPLIEIVSEPDLRTPNEAKAYLEKMKQILQYIDVSDCKMEEGSLRCDANISLRKSEEDAFGTKTELKNLNSFKAVQKGLEYEALRQDKVLSEGGKINQETRSWDDENGITVLLRSKEYADDYRYFPEPDLAPMLIDEKWVESIRKTLPELPDERKKRLSEKFGLSDYDSEILVASKEMVDYFDAVMQYKVDPKQAANWIMGELSKNLNAEGILINDCKVVPMLLAEMLLLIEKGTISGKIAKTVFDEMWQTGEKPADIVKNKGLVQISDEGAIMQAVEEAIANNANAVADFKAGKERALGALVGQVMKMTKGKANPEVVNKLLKEKLK